MIKVIVIWVNIDILFMCCFLWKLKIRNSFLSNLGWTNICLLSVVSYMQIFNVLFVVTKNYFDLIHYKSCIFSFCFIFIRFFCFHYASAQFLFVRIIHKLFTVNFIHSALLFSCMKSFYIVLKCLCCSLFCFLVCQFLYIQL